MYIYTNIYLNYLIKLIIGLQSPSITPTIPSGGVRIDGGCVIYIKLIIIDAISPIILILCFKFWCKVIINYTSLIG